MRIPLFLAALGLCTAAQAQVFRTYVASYGSDTNPCTVTAPCRLLPTALGIVNDGGEVWILDSANFNSGTVDIAKNVSIMALPGQIASIVAVNGNPAVTISAAGVRVGFRNVVIGNNAVQPGTYGVVVSNGAALWMEDSFFSNVNTYGIYTFGVSTRVDVKNTSFQMRAGYAIWAENGPEVTVANSRSSVGFASVASAAAATTSLTLSETRIAQAPGVGWGVLAGSQNATGTAYAHVDRCTIQSGVHGVHAESTAGGTAVLYIGGSTVTRAQIGLYANGTNASVASLGNNDAQGNQTDVSGAYSTVIMR